MPALKATSPILAKLAKKGIQKVVKDHKNDETDFGSGGELPAGLTGIAELTSAKFDEFKSGDSKGEPYAQYRGVIVECNEKLYVGNQVGKQVALCDDPKSWQGEKRTAAEHTQEALNELRKLGIETAKFDDNKLLEEWELAHQALNQARPFFKFHTWAPTNPQTKQPGRVRTDFDGVVDYQGNGQAVAGGVDDQSGTTTGGAEAPADAGAETVDWEAVGNVADAGDEAAIQQITEAGAACGVDTVSAASWSEAATAITAAQGGGTPTDAAAEAPWEPAVTEVYMWTPPTAKKGTKPAEHQIDHVDKAKKTVNLHNVANPKLIYKGIPWSAFTG